MRKLLSICLFMVLPIMMAAQTNVTSKIKNPSFESSGLNGWTQSGMSTQTNTAFSKKAGNTYVEKWTGRGGAVGSGFVSQTITGLSAGRYKLTVSAQNIQEDTPTSAQTGAYIFANDNKTTVTVTKDYDVEFTVIDGKATIGFKAEDASGNWLAVDNFRLYLTGDARDEVSAALSSAIENARSYYGSGDGKNADVLLGVIQTATTVLNDESSTSQQMADQIPLLESAVFNYRVDNASEESPLEMTSFIVNPSFEDNLHGWTNSNMGIQSNDAFTLKSGNNYVEKWTGKGGAVGDGSIMQTVTGIPEGSYRLYAAAQNIQEDTPSTTKTGAYIVGEESKTAVGVRKTYSVDFITLSNNAIIGFVASNAQGNWIACDNFRLEYMGKDQGALRAELKRRIDAAQTLVTKKMRATDRTALQNAIADATTRWNASGEQTYADVADALRSAVNIANESIAAYEKVNKALSEAKKIYNAGIGDNGREELNSVITNAQSLYDGENADNSACEQMVKALEDAIFKYQIDNGSGTVPTVKTDPRYARGCIEAFGRMTVSGIAAANIKEQGFCYATHPDPTVLDSRSTDYLENNGRIYRMSMKPATVYYMRAYVMTTDYAVGYGDVIKLSTLPMGNVTYTYYNNDGGDFHYNKNTNALTEACYYWSNYTSINGFHVTANYSAGTPTADCGYGGGMRIGPNTGQRTGTMMHEMNHGIGGGTLGIWGGWEDSWMRTSMNGDWAGERANGVIRFWENREDIVITGAYDNAHWGLREISGSYSDSNTWCNKYPVNGSHLEAGNWAGPTNWNETQILYIGNSLIQQGFCEDGLVPVNYYSGAFCLPGYVFPQEDNQKYYIKNEDESRGLYSAYLVEGTNGQLTWKDMTEEEVKQNDKAAWYVSFTPLNQYYQIKNASTGHYISYVSSGTNGFKAVTRTSISNNENFHVIRGRHTIDVGTKSNMFSAHSYWLIHPENRSNPPCLTAAASNKVSANDVNLYDNGTAMRWIFLQADDVTDFEDHIKLTFTAEIQALVRQIQKLESTPHIQNEEGADEELDTRLNEILTLADNLNNASEAQALKEQTLNTAAEFLSKVNPKYMTRPFELTFMIENAAIDDNSGWSLKPTFSNSCCEFFQAAFDFNQTIHNLPKGTFKVMVQAFQRPGAYETAYNDFKNGTNNVNAVLYAGTDNVKIKHIAEGARTSKLDADDVSVGSPTRYIPNTMAGAAAYFAKKKYDNELFTTTNEINASLKIGLKGTVSSSGYWTIFDNFRLYYYGSLTHDQIVSINDVLVDDNPQTPSDNNVYNLQGVIVRQNATTLEGLEPGVYIVNGKKYMVK